MIIKGYWSGSALTKSLLTKKEQEQLRQNSNGNGNLP